MDKILKKGTIRAVNNWIKIIKPNQRIKRISRTYPFIYIYESRTIANRVGMVTWSGQDYYQSVDLKKYDKKLRNWILVEEVNNEVKDEEVDRINDLEIDKEAIE